MAVKEKSHGRKTRVKASQFRKLFDVDLELHKQRYPNEPYCCIELYGGKFMYDADESGPPFKGSAANFCELASNKGVNFNYVAYEEDYTRALGLVNGLIDYRDRVKIYNIDNSAARTIDTNTKHGMIVADANGMFDFELVKDLHINFPNYSLLLNFNATTLKRQRNIGKFTGAKHKSNLWHLLSYFGALPKWPRYVTAPKDIHHWLVTYLRPDEVPQEQIAPFVKVNTQKGIDYLFKAAFTVEEIKLNTPVILPFGHTLKDVLGI